MGHKWSWNLREYTLILENLSVHHLDQPLFFGLLTHKTIILLVASNNVGDATQIIDLSDDLTITRKPLMFCDRLSEIAEDSYPAQSLHSGLLIFCRRAMFWRSLGHDISSRCSDLEPNYFYDYAQLSSLLSCSREQLSTKQSWYRSSFLRFSGANINLK